MPTPLDNFSSNISKVSFATLINYLKIDPSSSSATCPALSAGGTYKKTVTHNLGYIPHFEVYQEQSPGGAIVNAQMQVGNEMGTDLVTMNYPNAMDFLGNLTGYVYVSTTQLIITMANNTGSTSNAFKFWWRIYLQYGNQS